MFRWRQNICAAADRRAGHSCRRRHPPRRVALLAGCAQPALKPEINAAAIRLLTRHGVEVVVAEGLDAAAR